MILSYGPPPMPTSYLKAERLPAWNTYAVSKLDQALNGLGSADGILDRSELEHLTRTLEREVATLDASHFLDDDERNRLRKASTLLGEANRLVDDLREAGARGLVYLPNELLEAFASESLDDLDVGSVAMQVPENLRRRAAEILAVDDQDRFGRLSSEVLAKARARYAVMDVRVGLHTMRSRETALREIDELSNLLGHRAA